MNKEILIDQMNADAQALTGLRFVAANLLNQISETRRAGKDTSAAMAAYDNEIIGYRPDGKEVCKALSNRAAILEKHNYLRGCITAMEAMRLEPDFDELAVESMKAGIPTINVFADR